MTAVINGVPHHMARVYPTAETWEYTHQANGGFDAYFIARYRAKSTWLSPWRQGTARYPTTGTRHFDIVAAPAVSVEPTELHFYFDDDVPNTDQTLRLRNGLPFSSVQVISAAVQADTNTMQAGGEAFFTLISPTAFSIPVPPNGSQPFVVHFTNSTVQRNAQLAIVTSEGTFIVRLGGKYYLW